MTSNRQTLGPVGVFAIFFAGALFLGAVFQWFILPALPWHAGYGLMAGGDWVQFFNQARDLAARIETSGWREWELRYQGQWPASVMAVAFVNTGWEHPSVVLPIYAAVYGLAPVAFLQIARLTGLRLLSPWLIIAVFAFPSVVLIWGQPHKDVFALAGKALPAWAWALAWLGQAQTRWVVVSILVSVGLVVMWLPRPYLIEVVLVALVAATAIALLVSPNRKRNAFRGVFFVLVVLVVALSLKAIDPMESEVQENDVGLCETWLPEYKIRPINDKVGKMMCYRHRFIDSYRDAGSSIDHDRLLTNYRELISYLPRSALLAVVSPVPRLCAFNGSCETTSPGGGVVRLVVALEMLVFYVVLVGWVFWLSGHANKDVRSLMIGFFVFFTGRDFLCDNVPKRGGAVPLPISGNCHMVAWGRFGVGHFDECLSKEFLKSKL